MNRRWRFIGRLFLLLALFVYLDQIFRRHYSWHWEDLWHHQVVVAIALSIGITLLIVAAVQKRHAQKHRNRNTKTVTGRSEE